jgi:hypothetical protein
MTPLFAFCALEKLVVAFVTTIQLAAIKALSVIFMTSHQFIRDWSPNISQGLKMVTNSSFSSKIVL